MRQLVPILAVALLAGCTSTRFVESSWEDPADLQRISSEPGDITVLLDDPTVLSRTRQEYEDGYTEKISARRLSDVRADSVRVWAKHGYARRVPIADITELRFRQPQRRTLYTVLGAVAGGYIGGALGAAAGFKKASDGCSEETNAPPGCELTLGTIGGGVYGFIGLALGATVGGILGRRAATRRVIYRFHRDTPQQISVVVGVSPGR